MKDTIKIYANDGKEFVGTNYKDLVNECNAYEADQKLRQEKAEAERKAREEKNNQLRQYRVEKLNEINDIIHKANDMIVEYEKETGRKVTYVYDYTTKNFMVTDTRNSIDFAWDNVAEEIAKAIKIF